MQRVDVYQQHVVVAVDELDRLVHLAVLDRPRQSPEAADAVVDVHDVIAYFQRVEFLNRQAFASVQLAPDTVALVAVEYLVVGVETVFRRMVDEPRVQCQRNGVEDDVLLSDRVEDVRQPLDLSLVVGEQTGRIASQTVRVDVVGQQIEFLVEFGLGRRVERDADFGGRSRTLSRSSTKAAFFASERNPLRLVTSVSIDDGSSRSPRIFVRMSSKRLSV